jgi:hypothetical protein
MTFYQRVLGVLFSDLSPMRWIMGWIALVLSAGFFLTSTDNHNYDLINLMANRHIWGILFCVLAIIHLYSSLYPKCSFYIKALFNVLGIWLWSYVFLSFTFYDPTPIKATEWMLGLPILVEVWLLSEAGIRRKR